MDYENIKNAPGIRVKVPMCKQGKLADFRPALASTTLQSGGFHRFAVINEDYTGKIRVVGTAANTKGCSFTYDNTI
jgi:hypothetical protein